MTFPLSERDRTFRVVAPAEAGAHEGEVRRWTPASAGMATGARIPGQYPTTAPSRLGSAPPILRLVFGSMTMPWAPPKKRSNSPNVFTL